MRVLSFVILLAVAWSATAIVIETVDYEHYDVRAQGNKDLPTLLNEASPYAPYFGFTRWQISWTYRYAPLSNGRCRIQNVVTSLTVTITLPDPSDPKISRNESFKTLLAALKKHELGHYEIARQVANEIDRGILGLPNSNTCPELTAIANHFGNRLIERGRQTEARYDRDTQHGKTQGAWIERSAP